MTEKIALRLIFLVLWKWFRIKTVAISNEYLYIRVINNLSLGFVVERYSDRRKQMDFRHHNNNGMRCNHLLFLFFLFILQKKSFATNEADFNLRSVSMYFFNDNNNGKKKHSHNNNEETKCKRGEASNLHWIFFIGNRALRMEDGGKRVKLEWHKEIFFNIVSLHKWSFAFTLLFFDAEQQHQLNVEE